MDEATRSSWVTEFSSLYGGSLIARLLSGFKISRPGTRYDEVVSKPKGRHHVISMIGDTSLRTLCACLPAVDPYAMCLAKFCTVTSPSVA